MPQFYALRVAVQRALGVAEPINYTDFGDMPGIILNNWSDFQDLFDSQEWVKTRFADMEKSRNVIAQNNVLGDSEIDRIRLYL